MLVLLRRVSHQVSKALATSGGPSGGAGHVRARVFGDVAGPDCAQFIAAAGQDGAVLVGELGPVVADHRAPQDAPVGQFDAHGALRR